MLIEITKITLIIVLHESLHARVWSEILHKEINKQIRVRYETKEVLTGHLVVKSN